MNDWMFEYEGEWDRGQVGNIIQFIHPAYLIFFTLVLTFAN